MKIYAYLSLMMGFWRLPGMFRYFSVSRSNELPELLQILTGVFLPSEGAAVCLVFMIKTKFFNKIRDKKQGKKRSKVTLEGSNSNKTKSGNSSTSAKMEPATSEGEGSTTAVAIQGEEDEQYRDREVDERRDDRDIREEEGGSESEEYSKKIPKEFQSSHENLKSLNPHPNTIENYQEFSNRSPPGAQRDSRSLSASSSTAEIKVRVKSHQYDPKHISQQMEYAGDSQPDIEMNERGGRVQRDSFDSSSS